MFRTTACLLSLLSLSFSSSLLLLLLFFYLAIRRVCFRGTDITIIIIIDHFYMNCFLDQQIRSTSLVFSFFFCCCCCCCCCSLFVYRICTEFDSGKILAHSTLLFESILWFTKPGLLSDQDVPGKVRFSWVLLTSALSTAWKSCSPCCCHVMAQRQIYSPSDRFCRHQKCSPKTGQQF